LTSIIINIFENSLQFKPHVNHWCSSTHTRIQTNTINGKTTSSVRNMSGRTAQPTYKLPWLSVGYSIILYDHYRNCAYQLKPMDVYILHFLSENICAKTNQARCLACNETTQYEDEHMAFQFLHPSRNPLSLLTSFVSICTLH